MSVASIIGLLEIARGYCRKYPDLHLTYAIGLTVFRHEPSHEPSHEQYVELLRGHDPDNGYPGGEIPKGVYDTIIGRSRG